MFDFDAGKLLVIGIVALIVIGPKELPRVLRQVGQTVGKLRRMAAEFQSQFMDAVKEAELDDIRGDLAKMADQSKIDTAFNPLHTVRRELTEALADKPTEIAPTEIPPLQIAPTEAAPLEIAPAEIAPMEIAGAPSLGLEGLPGASEPHSPDFAEAGVAPVAERAAPMIVPAPEAAPAPEPAAVAPGAAEEEASEPSPIRKIGGA